MKSSVGTKIGLGYALAIAALIIIGLVSYRNIEQMTRSAALVSHTHQVKGTLQSIIALANGASTSVRGYLITGQPSMMEDYRRMVGGNGIQGEIDVQTAKLRELVKDNDEQTDTAVKLVNAIEEHKRTMNNLVLVRNRGGIPAVQREFRDGAGNKLIAIRSIIDQMTEREDVLLKGRQNDESYRVEATQATIRIGVPVCIILLGIIGWVTSLSIARPLQEMSSAARRVAAGDLRVEVPGEGRNDEVGVLGQAFNGMIRSLRETSQIAESIADGDLRVEVRPQSDHDILGKSLRRMVENLRAVMSDVGRANNMLATAASQLASSSMEMAASSSQTSSAVVETTATVSEVRQTAQVASQEANMVADRAQQAAQSAVLGREATDAANEGMHRIREQMDSIASSMVRLSEQTQAIGNIITSVDDLTQQSNLLAVNAAIEAAKAGERGKGFAVVAQEVKSLAEQSKAATTQVRTILSEIQKATGAAVMATEQGTKAVENGVQQFVQAGQSIRSLAANVAEAAQSARQIALSSQEQLVGVEQVAQAMDSIKQASAQNVESARQLEDSARDLTALGSRMQQQLDRYDTGIDHHLPLNGSPKEYSASNGRAAALERVKA